MARRIYQGGFKDGNGSAVEGGSVTVYLAGSSTLATIYVSETGVVVSGSSTTSAIDGSWSFWIDLADYPSTQLFKVVLAKSGYVSKTYDNIALAFQLHSAVLDTISTDNFFGTFEAITVTRDLTAASGDVAYTGLSSTPRRITFCGGVDGTTIMTDGKTNGTWQNCRICIYTTGSSLTFSNCCVKAVAGSGDIQTAVIKSMDANGFTLTWTKTGNPTGTLTLQTSVEL